MGLQVKVKHAWCSQPGPGSGVALAAPDGCTSAASDGAVVIVGKDDPRHAFEGGEHTLTTRIEVVDADDGDDDLRATGDAGLAHGVVLDVQKEHCFRVMHRAAHEVELVKRVVLGEGASVHVTQAGQGGI